MLWWRCLKKKKMKMIGYVEVPKEAFLKLLSDEE